MKTKNFIISAFAGGIVNYMLGWILWGILFKNSFPVHKDEEMNMLFIFLGCMTFSFFMTYFFSKSTIVTVKSAAISGAIFGLLIQLYHNFFYHSLNLSPDSVMILTDVALTVFCGAIVGVVIAVVNRKLK
jgi:hypothetical protein